MLEFGVKFFNNLRRTLNFSMETFLKKALDEEKHFKHVFKYAFCENLRKFTGSYKKVSIP